MRHNIQTRRARQAARHRKELESAQLHQRLLAQRVAFLTNSDPYKAGFAEGVTVTIQQLLLWLTDSRASAQQLIDATPVDHDNPDFRQGYSLASAWIDEAIEKLQYELEERARAQMASEMAAGVQEEGGSGLRSGLRGSEQDPGGATDPGVGG